MSDTTVAEKAAVLRKEASERLTDIFFNIHRQLTPNFDPSVSLLPQKIDRIVECLVSAAMLELTDVFRQGLKEGTDTGGRSCNCDKS